MYPTPVATSGQLNSMIQQLNSGGVGAVQNVYNTLLAQGFSYAGWANGVAQGDSMTGIAAVDYLRGSALMGLGGPECRNLTQAQIDKIKVDIASGSGL